MAQKRKRPSSPPDNPVRGAAAIFAITIATDEEYAAGLPFKDPQAILTGKKRPTRKPKKR